MSLHAPGVVHAFEIISKLNGIGDAQASQIRLAVYIRSIGDWREPEKRRVAEVHEVARVIDGVPLARLLHRWDEATDRFLDIDQPTSVDRGLR